MAYEKALSLISGGGKTFEVEHEGLDHIIKATPDEMQAGAIVIEEDVKAGNGGYVAYFVVYKYTDSNSKPAIEMLTASADSATQWKTRVVKFTYDEAKGGYVAELS